MKTATLRQLRNETSMLVKWVEAGESVLVTKRSKPLFRLLPAYPAATESRPLPNFLKRQSELFPQGRIPISGAELIAEGRERF